MGAITRCCQIMSFRVRSVFLQKPDNYTCPTAWLTNKKMKKGDILSLRHTYDIVKMQLFANNTRLVQILNRLLNMIPPAGKEKQQDTPLFYRRHLVRGRPLRPRKNRVNTFIC